MKTNTPLHGLLALLLFAFVWAACNNDPDIPPRPNPPTPTPTPTPTNTSIEGQWRLVGFGDTATYGVDRIDTADYPLAFRPDGKLLGRDISGHYSVKDTTLRLTLTDADEKALPTLTRRLRDALRRVEGFRVEPDVTNRMLRLYYADGRRYLLFTDEPLPVRTVPVPLTGRWKLIALGNDADGSERPPKPNYHTLQYVFTLYLDGSLSGTSATNSFSAQVTLHADSLRIAMGDLTTAPEDGDGNLYIDALRHAVRYELNTSTKRLKIRYADGRRYLLFRAAPDLEKSRIPSLLLRQWQFVGFGRTADGSLTKIPSRSGDHFRLFLRGNGTWTTSASTQLLRGAFHTDGQYLTFDPESIPSLSGEDAVGQRYINALRQVSRFAFAPDSNDELLLYYADGREYLLFRDATPIVPGSFTNRLINVWKLVAFGRTANSSERSPETLDFQQPTAFMIEFTADFKLIIASSTNRLSGYFIANGNDLRITCTGGTKVNEMPDGHKYLDALDRTERFELTTDGRLKIYYNEGLDYLLFRAAPELIATPPPAALLGRWTLATHGRGLLGPVKYPRGQHVLTFLADGRLEVEGLQLFLSKSDDLRYVFCPWGEPKISIGGRHYDYRLEGDQLQLAYKPELDGSTYLFEKMR